MDAIIQEIQRAITQLNHDYTALAESVAYIRSQVEILMWCFKAIIGGLLALIISQVWQLIILKNNKKNSK